MKNSHRIKIVFISTFLLQFCLGCGQRQPVEGPDESPNPSQSERPSPEQDGQPDLQSSSTIPEEEWDLLVFAVLQGGQAVPQGGQAVPQSGHASIHLAQKSVTETHLHRLEAADNLVELLLDQGTVNDSGLALIAKHCPKLEHLRLRLSPISDLSAAALAELQELRVLNLPHSILTADGLKSLRNLEKLELIRLGGRQLDDRAVEELVRLPQLESLHLISPGLTDASLEFLARAPKLTSLYLDDCTFSPDAWARLEQAKPDLHIHVNQAHWDW